MLSEFPNIGKTHNLLAKQTKIGTAGTAISGGI